MNNNHPVIVRVSRRFDTSPERVFDAWLDPATAGRWLFATPGGQMQRVAIDARVDGVFAIAERRSSGLAEHFGRYLEIDRPHRLVFLFSNEASVKGGDRVTVEIVSTGTGCTLTLTHEMNAEHVEYTARTQAGWTHVLASLARHLDAD